ncbi:PREDICTED: uncharacterized protein C14orf93-like [Branchiostoma belcheri]|uniref:Uncharacterized protein C14orf93-like n=1 Tax=Branchiostoma belcheri TaxID=7741 RepID=A0A6P4ZLY1_BRABE|nr:PREDICTED: uncharacterized protein C14orf93-like [Branchiostoma belcheri]
MSKADKHNLWRLFYPSSCRSTNQHEPHDAPWGLCSLSRLTLDRLVSSSSCSNTVRPHPAVMSRTPTDRRSALFESSNRKRKGKNKRKGIRPSPEETPSTGRYEASPSKKDIWRVLSALSEQVTELKKGQEEMKAEMKKSLDGIQTTVDSQPTSLPPAPATPKKVPPMLSRKVREIHNGLGEMQYRGSELFKSDHNKKVTEMIQRAVRDDQDPNKPWKRSHISRSCSNYHETVRRRERRAAAGKDEEDALESKRNNRRTRLLERRQLAGRGVLTAEDQRLLDDAKPRLMSDEESEIDDKDTWLVRSPTWRSKRFNKILLLCDTELDKKPDKNNKRTRRVRTNQPCTRSPPDVEKVYLKTDEDTEEVQEQGTEVEHQEETEGTDKDLGGIESERQEESQSEDSSDTEAPATDSEDEDSGDEGSGDEGSGEEGSGEEGSGDDGSGAEGCEESKKCKRQRKRGTGEGEGSQREVVTKKKRVE